MARVLIVGAGPAGAALGVLLARRGIGVQLLERQSDFSREFRGEVLMPSGLDALAQMGLAGALASVPQTRIDSVEIYRDGRRLFRVTLDPESFGAAGLRVVSQTHMLEMLVAEAARSPEFRLERGVVVRDLVMQTGRAVGVRADTASGARELRADLVIGADGRASVVRRRASLPADVSPVAFDVVWFKVPWSESIDPEVSARGYIGRGHLLLCLRSWDERMQIGWIIEKGSFGELRRRGIEAWVEEMAAHVSPELAAHLRRHAASLTQPFLLSVVCDCLERWSAPGLLTLGDAAHPMSPVGGQGINIALRDAIVAANHLVPVLTSGAHPDAVDAACRAFQDERMPEVREVQRMQQGPPRVLLRRAWWSGIALRIVPWLLRLDLARARQGVFLRRFAFGVADVKLRV